MYRILVNQLRGLPLATVRKVPLAKGSLPASAVPGCGAQCVPPSLAANAQAAQNQAIPNTITQKNGRQHRKTRRLARQFFLACSSHRCVCVCVCGALRPPGWAENTDAKSRRGKERTAASSAAALNEGNSGEGRVRHREGGRGPEAGGCLRRCGHIDLGDGRAGGRPGPMHMSTGCGWQGVRAAATHAQTTKGWRVHAPLARRQRTARRIGCTLKVSGLGGVRTQAAHGTATSCRETRQAAKGQSKTRVGAQVG